MSELEKELLFHIKLLKLPTPVVEYKFCTDRKWRADFCWPEQKLIVEVEGGIHSGGRHVRGKGFEKDCEKYNNAVLLGFRVLRVTADQIKSAIALTWIEEALNGI